MIILLKDSELNRKAGQILQQHYHLNQTVLVYPLLPELEVNSGAAERCFIIDLEEPSYFRTLLTPEQFAKDLASSKIISTVTDIYLVACENIAFEPVMTFAHRLAKFLSQYEKRKIAVHTLSEINYEETQIVLVPEKNSWEIYGIKTIKGIRNKKLLWKGSEITDWFNDPQRTLTGITPVWSD